MVSAADVLVVMCDMMLQAFSLFMGCVESY